MQQGTEVSPIRAQVRGLEMGHVQLVKRKKERHL